MNKDFDKKLSELKSPIPEIREGAYTFFLKFFEEREVQEEEKTELLNLLFSNEFLFLEIDRGESDFSVARSFSLLLINLIFYSDDDFKLSPESIIPKLTEYLGKEKDIRGKDSELGFVHAFPHFSDLLLTLNWHKRFSEKEVHDLAFLFKSKILSFGRNSFSEEDWLRMDDALEQIL